MKAKGAFYPTVALVLLASVFCFTTYRAAVQAIAHDEALTYLWFLDGGIGKVLVFNANNHVLFTLLAKPIVKTFGVSELSLRAAALLGCALYLVAAFLLSRRLFGDSPLMPMTVAVLILNPTVMDFLAAGRGYGLGLGFLTLAIYFLARTVENETPSIDNPECRRHCAVASALLGLSVAANLSNVIPAFGLAVGLLWAKLGLRVPPLRPVRDVLRAFARCFILPGVLVGLFILWPFLIQARPQHFYVGYDSIGDSARDLFSSSFLYKWTDDQYATLGAVPSASNSWQQRVSNLGIFVMLPACLLFLLGFLVFLRRTSRASPPGLKGKALLFGGATLTCVVVVLLLHFLAHVKYPLSRTALYAIPLFSISIFLEGATIVDLGSNSLRPLLRIVGSVVILTVLIDYAASLNKSYFRYNAYDRISRELFLAVMRDAQPRHVADLRIGGTWWFEPEINFYRRRYKATILLPYDVKDPTYPFQATNSLIPRDYDYFVYTEKNRPDLTGRRVREVFRDPVTDLTAVAIDR